MLEGVLFDMDGVLFDTERLYEEIDRKVARDMGFDISYEVYLSQVGSNYETVGRIFTQALGPSFDYPHFIQRVHEELLNTINLHGIPKKPGAAALLHWLKEKGWAVAVASSSSAALVHQHLEQAGFLPCIDAVVGGDMVQASKPAPDIFLAAAKAIGLPAARCAAIEDSYNGVASAAAAGCATIMVPDVLPPTDETRRQAAATLASLEEVASFLTQYNAENPT